ncbi:hypothetical protein NEOKW01_0035 [Nematocida sp. AWRm80]|nr:hypothetical protein NEOKW01_0035 [Nematocida sp. AWRm80]
MERGKEKERQEKIEYDHSTETEEEIRKMLDKVPSQTPEGLSVHTEENIPSEKDIHRIISLMSQLSIQYDELEGYLKGLSTDPRLTDTFPIEVVSSFIKSTRISPTLLKIISTLTEETKKQQKEIGELKKREDTANTKLGEIISAERTKKLETKYMEQSLKEATKEIKAQREDVLLQKRRILELEGALEAQKKISKGLLREKTATQKEIDIHEEEKRLLKEIIDKKDGMLEQMARTNEEQAFDLKRIQRENEILEIQQTRLRKRLELKDRTLTACTTEVEKLIKQLDRLTKMDTHMKEKLEHLKIIKTRLEHENQLLQRSRKNTAHPGDKYTSRKETYQNNHPRKTTHTHSEHQQPRERQRHRNTEYTETEDSQYSQSHSEPSKPDTLSEPDLFQNSQPETTDSYHGTESTSDRTATSFREMQKKTEEMSKKFKELEDLLKEIKHGNEEELASVEQKITNHAARNDQG